MSAPAQSVPAVINRFYLSTDHGDEWHLVCKICSKGWALKKDSTHTGNVLFLFNHALSHKANR